MTLLLALLACAGAPPIDRKPPPPDDVGTVVVDTGTDAPVPVPQALSAVSVSLHPDISTVLTVTWNQSEAADVWLSWEMEGQRAVSPVRALAAGDHREHVFGVPSLTTIAWLTVHALVDGAEQQVNAGSHTTGPLPADLSDADLDVASSAARPEPFLLTSLDVGPVPFYGPCYTVILDAAGRIVWYRPSEGKRLTWQPRVSRRDGLLLIDASTTYAFSDDDPPTVTRVSLDRSVEDAVPLPGMMVAYDELDDGSLLFDERESDVVFHLTRRYPDGTTERVWSCWPWMVSYSAQAWGCATNTVLWSPVRNTVLWSTFETAMVIEIDLGTGEVAAEYGPYPGGPDFEPPEAAFVHQHGPNWTPAGTLLLSAHEATGRQQLAWEYDVDNGAVASVWQAQSDDLAAYGGRIRALPSGNRLWQLGTAGIIREITPEGVAVWQASWPTHLVGDATPLADLYTLTP